MLNTERFSIKFVLSKKLFLFSSILVLFAFYLAGCVNVEQKTTLKQDGSGTMKVHYWTKMSNVKSSTEVGSFSFDEAKAKTNYTSSNNEVGDVKIEEKLADSTKHVTLDLKFKNINDINSAKGFEKVKASWKEGKDGMDFSYTLAKDTSNAKNMGASDTKLDYEFDFPAEVIRTNGTKDGQKVKWGKTLADLKEDIEMTATVKNEGKKCGLFGMEFPLMALAAMAVMSIRIRRKK
ncbi:MAG: hypothetical protein IT281_00030 [Ignavibacteria bacterium]|nr:hypothetical protein [Ignavibacteria bacterium]MCC7157905.1 hypothetical protein [Ignavibacteria bacterium]